MKIVAASCFHGRIPGFLRKEARDADLLLGAGDFTKFHLRDVFFKHCYRTDKELCDVVGVRKYERSVRKDIASCERVLHYLDKLGLPIAITTGNSDYSKYRDALDKEPQAHLRKYSEAFHKDVASSENIADASYKAKKCGEHVIIGYPQSSFPGRVKSKAYKKQRALLEKLFKKYDASKIIFLIHNPPYECGKLDLIGGDAHKKAAGKHYGSKLCRRLIDKYQPLLCVSGHVHENQGVVKLGKTTVVNCGYGEEGEYAVINVTNREVKVKLINHSRKSKI